MDWMELISAELVVLVAFLLAVGQFLKEVPKFKDYWAIPLILWLLGIAFSIALVLLDNGPSLRNVLDGVIQGTFVAAAAVFGHQVIKQITVDRTEE